MLSMFLYESPHPIDLVAAKATAVLKHDWIEPEFGDVLISFDVNVWWLVSVTGVEKESVRTDAQYGWHGPG